MYVHCPKCNDEAEARDITGDELIVHCNKCGDSEFTAIDIPKELVFKFVEMLVETGKEHQHHAFAGMLARRTFIKSNGQEFPDQNHENLLKNGDELYQAAEEACAEREEHYYDPIAILATLAEYDGKLEYFRDVQMAMVKTIADIKQVEVPESCLQDFCNEKQER